MKLNRSEHDDLESRIVVQAALLSLAVFSLFVVACTAPEKPPEAAPEYARPLAPGEKALVKVFPSWGWSSTLTISPQSTTAATT